MNYLNEIIKYGLWSIMKGLIILWNFVGIWVSFSLGGYNNYNPIAK